MSPYEVVGNNYLVVSPDKLIIIQFYLFFKPGFAFREIGRNCASELGYSDPVLKDLRHKLSATGRDHVR
jgi:hypothetical protein